MRWAIPACLSTSVARATSPAFATPGSLTTRGLVILRRSTWFGRRDRAPTPNTTLVGKDISVIRCSAKFSIFAHTPSLDQLQITLELPGCHGSLGTAEDADRVLEAARQGRRIVAIGVALARRWRLDLVLDSPKPRGKRGRHSDVGVHVRAEKPELDPGCLRSSADRPQRGGPVFVTPGGAHRRPGILDAAFVAVDRRPVEGGEFGHQLELTADVMTKRLAHHARLGGIVKQVAPTIGAPERLVDVPRASGQLRIPFRPEARGQPMPRADLLDRGLEKNGLIAGSFQIVIADRGLVDAGTGLGVHPFDLDSKPAAPIEDGVDERRVRGAAQPG